jgi:hypothetical protein
MVTLAWVLIAFGGIASLVGGIVLLIVAFRISVGWGLVLLFLSWLVIPLVVFLVKHWDEARLGFFTWIAGGVLSGVGFFVLAGSVATVAVADYQEMEAPPPRTISRDRPSSSDAFFAADETTSAPEAPVMPTVPEPTPTPEPADDTSSARGPSEDPPKIIDVSQATEHLGEWMVITLVDGTEPLVVLDAVTLDELQVTQRMGGGAVSYRIKRASVVSIRLLH